MPGAMSGSLRMRRLAPAWWVLPLAVPRLEAGFAAARRGISERSNERDEEATEEVGDAARAL